MFSMQDGLESQQSGMWMGFQTLLQNAPQGKQQPDSIQEIDEDMKLEDQIIKSTHNKHKNKFRKEEEKQKKLFEEIPNGVKWLYLAGQVTLLVVIGVLMIYSYLKMLDFHDEFEHDTSVKQLIEEVESLPMKLALQTSHLLYHANSPLVIDSVNLTAAVQKAKYLQSKSELIYQDLLLKQKEGLMSFSELLLEVTYYNSISTMFIKEQSVMDAVYQLSTYFLEIYESNQPSTLTNNKLFVFMNNEVITTSLEDLNNLYTNIILQKNRQIFEIQIFFSERESEIMNLVIVSLCLIGLSLIFQILHHGIIIGKVVCIVDIFTQIPIEELEKYPKKCEKFSHFVIEIQNTNTSFIKSAIHSVKEIGNFGNISGAKIHKNQNQDEKLALLEEEEGQIQQISFTNVPSLKSTLWRNFIFFAVVVIVFVGSEIYEKSKLEGNGSIIGKWIAVNQFIVEVPKTNYFLNELKNIDTQWNSTMLTQMGSNYESSVLSIEHLLNRKTQMDDYLSKIYTLLDDSKSIANFSVMGQPEIQKLLQNQNSFKEFTDSLKSDHVDQFIETEIKGQIGEFYKLMELFFVVKIFFFLGYAVIYLPLAFKNFSQKYTTSLLMLDTLGHRLLNIAKQNRLIEEKRSTF